MLTFKIRYFIIALTLFAIEVFIAVFIHDQIIRPHIGDFLVVILIYCMIRSFLKFSIWKTAIITLLFSFAVELSQYFNIVERVHLQDFRLARIVIGTTFSRADLLAYTLGVLFVLLIEKMVNRNSFTAI